MRTDCDFFITDIIIVDVKPAGTGWPDCRIWHELRSDVNPPQIDLYYYVFVPQMIDFFLTSDVITVCVDREDGNLNWVLISANHHETYVWIPR